MFASFRRHKPDGESSRCVFCGEGQALWVYTWKCYLCPDHRLMLSGPTSGRRTELQRADPTLLARFRWKPAP